MLLTACTNTMYAAGGTLDPLLQSVGTALGYAFATFLTAIAVPLSVLAVQAARWLGAKLKVSISAETEQQIKFAAETGVLRAADKLRDFTGQGDMKKAIAIDTAKVLAPRSFGSLPAGQQQAIIEATYAKLRPSLQALPPISSLPISSLPPGTSLVLSLAPTLPPVKPAVEEGTTSASGTYQPVEWPPLPPETPKPTPAELADPKLPRPSAVPREGTVFADPDADTRPATPGAIRKERN